MARRPAAALAVLCTALVTVAATAGPGGAGIDATAPGVVAAAHPTTLSTADRLGDRRYVAAGTRAYDIGTEAGRYPAMGFHTRGEMGGVWSPPIKLLDGLWFGVDGHWVGPAKRFTSGYGYVSMDLPRQRGLQVTRTDFVPDGRRAVLVGLRLSGASATTTMDLAVDAHSELMSAYPWSATTPNQETFNLRDTVTVDRDRLLFRERGRPDPAAPYHDWAALVGAAPNPALRQIAHSTGRNFRGPQDPPVICPRTTTSPDTTPPRCDDTAYGKGAGGQLRYHVTVQAGRAVSLWFAVAGSEAGAVGARTEYAAATADPAGELAAKVAQRRALAGLTRLDLPGDPLLAQGIDWSKQNLADLRQEARDLRVRITHAGTVYRSPVGRVDTIRFIGAGFPDYPWMFATDGEYTAFANVGLGQFAAIEDHLRSLMQVSEVANHHSGKVVHETVTDGSVYFGANADDGNTDETVKFPSTVALLWRWTGDNAFRDQMYDFTRRNLHYVVDKLDADRDGWPEGGGNVEITGQGVEKLDSTVYLIGGLLDEAELATSKGDSATAKWASRHADALQSRFERAWWDEPTVPGYADSLADPGNAKVYQRFWTGVTPMEAELWSRDPAGHTVPGLSPLRHGYAALDLRETSCYSGPHGLFEDGQGATTATLTPPQPTFSCDGDRAVSSLPDAKIIFTLNTAVMAVAEGNYGRLGRQQQQRYTTDNRALMLPNPDEMPGALEEIAPSPPYPPYYGRSINRYFTQRAQVMQAWGSYGLVWPVVHQQLGISPDLGMGRLEVVPQVPDGQPSVAGSNIRLGTGAVAVRATASDGRYTATVRLTGTAPALTIGYAVPYAALIASVTLDGHPVTGYRLRLTNRGQEVLVPAGPGGSHSVVVTTG